MNEFERFEKALQAAEQAGDVAGAQALASQMRQMMKADFPGIDAPADPRVEASKMAAKGVGIPEAMTIGAGRGLDRIGAGIQQLAHLSRVTPPPGGGAMPPQHLQEQSKAALGDLATEQGEKDIAFSGLQKARPFATGIGEAAPYALAARLPMGLMGQSAAVGGVEASKYGTGEERMGRGILSGASNMVGGALGNAVGKAIAPVGREAISTSQRSALGSMDDIGVRPRMSEVTGSPFFARVEDWAARTPGGAGVMRKFAEGNQQAINRTAAQGIGETADELTPQVFAAANQRMGQVFEAIKGLGGKPIRVSSKVGDAADDILRQQKKMLPTQQDQNLINLANQAKTVATHRGRIDGETYQLIRSGLSEASFDASGSNKVLYGKLLSALDDAADSSLRAEGHTSLADALKTVRPQYANLKTLEKGAVAEAGNVSPARLASAMRSNNPASFREGRMQGNPLYEIAKMGEAFKPLQAGSPTYERTLMSNPISTSLSAMIANPAAKFVTSPAAQFYPRLVGEYPGAFGLLAQGANPAVRASSMGLLNNYANPMLLPLMMGD